MGCVGGWFFVFQHGGICCHLGWFPLFSCIRFLVLFPSCMVPNANFPLAWQQLLFRSRIFRIWHRQRKGMALAAAVILLARGVSVIRRSLRAVDLRLGSRRQD